MNDIELHEKMSILYKLFNENKIDVKKLISKSVQLGIDYQTNKIQTGIEIVFSELTKKTTN